VVWVTIGAGAMDRVSAQKRGVWEVVILLNLRWMWSWSLVFHSLLWLCPLLKVC
jgi:hypothetical protein